MSSQISKPARVATLAVWKDGQLMMGLRRDNMRWTTPGGHMNDAESPIAGALRELREETGLEARADEMQYLGSSQVTGRSGKAVELHMFQLDVGARPKVDIRNDPDQEVHGWSFVDVSNGIPAGLKAQLHTPKNHLFRALGLMEFDTEAKLAAPVALKAGEHLPPAEARRMSGLGLEFAAALGRKLPAAALARARALVEGRGMSADDIRSTAQYFELYGNCLGENDSRGAPTDRHLECMLWGGPSAARWARSLAMTMGSHRLASGPPSVQSIVMRHIPKARFKASNNMFTVSQDLGLIPRAVYSPDVANAREARAFADFQDAARSALAELGRHYVIEGEIFEINRGYGQLFFVAEPKSSKRLAADTTSGTSKGPTKEVVSRPMHEVSADIKKAGVDDNDQDPENDREIPGGPRRKTDGEMKEDPKEKTYR
jgi:8-oxo-dGTP pyrophosphatase MutT (NUDIX family)